MNSEKKNKALRDWRHLHSEWVKEYMKAWRIAKKEGIKSRRVNTR